MYNFRNSPLGSKVDTKSKLIRQLGDTVDLSSFDFQSGRHIPNSQQSLLHQQPAIRSTNMQRSIIEMLPSSVPPIKHPLSLEYRCLDCYIAFTFCLFCFLCHTLLRGFPIFTFFSVFCHYVHPLHIVGLFLLLQNYVYPNCPHSILTSFLLLSFAASVVRYKTKYKFFVNRKSFRF